MLSDTGKGCFKQASYFQRLRFKGKGLLVLYTREKQCLGEGRIGLLSKLEDLQEGKKILERDFVFFPLYTNKAQGFDFPKEQDTDFETCNF